MNKYLLDTNVVIAFIHRKFQMREKVKEVGLANCFISEITIAEFFYGCYASKFVDQNLLQMQILFDCFEIVTISNSLDEYGQQRARLTKQQQQQVGDSDLLIGAMAVHNDLTLVTANTKDFTLMTGIRQEDWSKPHHNHFLQTI